MHAQNRHHHFLLGDQAATDRRRKSRDRWVAKFHVIPVADIEPSEGNKSIQLGERCGARGWKNHRASWLANGTAQGGIFTGNSRGHHPTEPCPKAQSAPEGSGLALGVYGTLTARTLARSSLANPGSDPIPENPVSYRPPPQNRFLAVTEKTTRILRRNVFRILFLKIKAKPSLRRELSIVSNRNHYLRSKQHPALCFVLSGPSP